MWRCVGVCVWGWVGFGLCDECWDFFGVIVFVVDVVWCDWGYVCWMLCCVCVDWCVGVVYCVFVVDV